MTSSILKSENLSSTSPSFVLKPYRIVYHRCLDGQDTLIVTSHVRSTHVLLRVLWPYLDKAIPSKVSSQMRPTLTWDIWPGRGERSSLITSRLGLSWIEPSELNGISRSIRRQIAHEQTNWRSSSKHICASQITDLISLMYSVSEPRPFHSSSLSGAFMELLNNFRGNFGITYG